MDALLEGGTMLWTSHLGYHWMFLGECYFLYKVKKVYWGRDMVWTSHLRFIWRGGSFQVATSYLSAKWTPYWREELCYELVVTSHLGLIGGEGSTYHWRILVEWYSLKHVKKVYWGTDIVWTSINFPRPGLVFAIKHKHTLLLLVWSGLQNFLKWMNNTQDTWGNTC